MRSAQSGKVAVLALRICSTKSSCLEAFPALRSSSVLWSDGMSRKIPKFNLIAAFEWDFMKTLVFAPDRSLVELQTANLRQLTHLEEAILAFFLKLK